MTWLGFWAFFLALSIGAYVVMSLFVSIRAWSDLRRLLAQKDEAGDNDPSKRSRRRVLE